MVSLTVRLFLCIVIVHSYLKQVADRGNLITDLKLTLTWMYFRRYVVTVWAKISRKWLRRDGDQLINVSRGKRLALPDKLQAGFVVHTVEWVVGQAVAVYHCFGVTWK